LAILRTTVLDCGLSEELKWGVPCYTFQKANIVLIHVFKEYCAVLFVKGALLNDARGLLVQQTENTQSARQMRFANIQEIKALETDLKTYIYEAIEVEKAGLKVELKQANELIFPVEFQHQLDTDADLKIAFDALTPGRQRAYYLHFSEPKQAKTREARVEKCLPQIRIGKGLND
jgi:uncharacterized protein YdeI (YjbR/CyaY-like superfamily)